MVENEAESHGTEPSPPPMFDKKVEADAAFWRLKEASDEWREERIKRVLAQEGESILITLGRVIFITVCILIDGVVLTEVPISMGKTLAAWSLYLVLLMAAIKLQRDLYEKWFSVDINQINFDRQ